MPYLCRYGGPQRISRSSLRSALDIWNSIIDEADDQHRVRDVIRIAMANGYGDNPKLKPAIEAWEALQRPPLPPRLPSRRRARRSDSKRLLGKPHRALSLSARARPLVCPGRGVRRGRPTGYGAAAADRASGAAAKGGAALLPIYQRRTVPEGVGHALPALSRDTTRLARTAVVTRPAPPTRPGWRIGTAWTSPQGSRRSGTTGPSWRLARPMSRRREAPPLCTSTSS